MGGKANLRCCATTCVKAGVSVTIMAGWTVVGVMRFAATMSDMMQCGVLASEQRLL